MKLRVRLFAAARQRAGMDSVEVDLQGDASVSRLRVALGAQYPRLAALVPHLMFAVGSGYVSDREVLHENDDVACIPPVSGG